MSEENRFEPDQETEQESNDAASDTVSGALPGLSAQNDGLSGKISVRGLAEGAMMTALALILAVISIYVPVLNLIAPLLFPVPLAILVLRHGMKLGILSAASIFLLSSMLLGLPHALYLFIQYGFLGLFFGLCFRRQKKAAFMLVGGVLISSAALIFTFIFPSFVAGVSMEQYQEMMSALVNEYVSILQQQGARGELVMGGMTPAAFVTYMEGSLLRLLPSMLVTSAMGLTLLCYTLMCRLLRRFGYEVNKLPPFAEWRLDWHLLWALIAALALAGLGSRLGIDLMARIGDNLLMAFSPILLVCGISVLVWLMRLWRVATFVKVLAVLFLYQIFSGSFMYLLILVGVFDPIFDFRRRLELRREKKKMG